MPLPLSICTVQTDADAQDYAALTANAFQLPIDRAPTYIEAITRPNIRLARLHNQPAAGLSLIHTAQFWGSPIPMTGFAGVAVAPQFRSQGVGHQLMSATLHELFDAGIPLATLYPATQPVYRRLGFEAAGYSCIIELPLNTIDCREPSIEVRPATPDDQPAIHNFYRAWAAHNPGNLDRNEFFWARVTNFRGLLRTPYLLTRNGQPEGYFYVGHAIPAEKPRTLNVGDLVATTPAAARRFLQFLADHRSMVEKATWVGPPNDPLLLLLREQSAHIALDHYWMLRILHPAQALSLRTYPPLSTQLHLHLTDDLFPQNAGYYTLVLENGRPTVSRPTTATPSDLTLSMPISTLAPLFSSLHSAEHLAGLHLLTGSAAGQHLATSLFAAPTPWMRDPF